MRSTAASRGLLTACISLVLFLLSASAALAVKQAVQIIKPESSQDSGFSVKVKDKESGKLEFTVIRDLSKARSFPADSELMTRRSAQLNVSNSTELLASCELAADTNGQTVIYRFIVARECVPHSHLTIAEIDDYKDPNREHLIGGGAFYKIQLADFIEPASKHDR